MVYQLGFSISFQHSRCVNLTQIHCLCSFTRPTTDSGLQYFYALYLADTDKQVRAVRVFCC